MVVQAFVWRWWVELRTTFYACIYKKSLRPGEALDILNTQRHSLTLRNLAIEFEWYFNDWIVPLSDYYILQEPNLCNAALFSTSAAVHMTPSKFHEW